MTDYINATRMVVSVARVGALGVEVRDAVSRVCIHTGALANEEQGLDEYMEMLGYVPALPSHTLPPDVHGHITGFHPKSDNDWRTNLIDAMEELALATENNNKAAARLAKAHAAFERAKSNAENSIIGD